MLAPDASQVHHDWINTLPPRLEVEPGDTVGFDTRDDADLHYTPRGRRRHKPACSSNCPVEDWGKHLGDGAVVTTLLDRLPTTPTS
jgi:acetamidase/formamidase